MCSNQINVCICNRIASLLRCYSIQLFRKLYISQLYVCGCLYNCDACGVNIVIGNTPDFLCYTVVPVMNGHPRDQAKVSVHCRCILVHSIFTDRHFTYIAISGNHFNPYHFNVTFDPPCCFYSPTSPQVPDMQDPFQGFAARTATSTGFNFVRQ